MTRTPIDLYLDPTVRRELHEGHMRARNQMPIKPAGSSEEDAFACPPEGCRCVDRAGYHRREHAPDKDGRCIWCDRRVEARR